MAANTTDAIGSQNQHTTQELCDSVMALFFRIGLIYESVDKNAMVPLEFHIIYLDESYLLYEAARHTQ